MGVTHHFAEMREDFGIKSKPQIAPISQIKDLKRGSGPDAKRCLS
jgi:hypothetical protein